MPVLRSQRGQPTKRKGEEEVAPPLAPSPPKAPKARATRTRSKKVSKQEEVEVPKSPTPSTSSKRSTRTKRTKPEPVEEIAVASPPATRSTRSTRKKTTTTSKASKSSSAVAKTKEKEQKGRSEDVPDPTPAVTIPAMTVRPKEKKPATAKKGKGRQKKEKTPIESTSEDITEGESDMEHKEKQLSLRQLHKNYVAPLKTVLDAASASGVFPQLVSRIMDRKAFEEQDKTFERLMRSTATEMPPPAAPKPKGKGRQKRARSPEKTQVKTKVPESFNFAVGGTEDHVPAKKKMIMDQPTPEKEQAPAEENIFEQSVVVDADFTGAVSTEALSNSDESSKKEVVVEVVDSSQKPNTEACNEIPEKTTTTAVVPKKKSVVLDETYVFETPKDDKKENGPMLNTTFTPELFVDTPKARPVDADKTVIISKATCEEKKVNKDALEDSILAPASPEPDNHSDASSSASGMVSSLVNFFDKNKKEVEVASKKEVEVSSKKGKTPSICKTDNAEVSEIDDKITSVPTSTKHESVVQETTDNNDLNSTYCLPPTKNKNESSSMLNVTVCVKKANKEVVVQEDAIKPILPPTSLFHQTSSSRFMQDSPASRTFVKEPPSLAVVMEEDDESKDKDGSSKSKKTNDQTKPVASIKLIPKDKEPHPKKGVSSSSSSSSCSSLKSASSQPCLLSSTKKLPSSAAKNGPNYGSAGKLHEVLKSKPLEDAEKRRQELLQQKVENSKKKREEWTKKTEKIKQEEEKRLKEKQKVTQPISGTVILKKPVPLALGKTAPEAAGGLVLPKPKYNFGPSISKNHPPPLSKNPFKSSSIHPPHDTEMDESFKSASSFLDQTTEGHLSSYDITVYEDLDEDLKHRENKTLPNWASDKEALKIALFSMVLLPDYEQKLTGGFPKPDKSFKLFPNRTGHH